MENSKQLNNAERRMINGMVQVLTREGIKVVGATIAGGVGDTSALALENTQLLLGKETTLQTLNKEATQKLGVWDSIICNSKVFTFYSGIEAGNPSGVVDNIKLIEYKTGGVTQITQTYTWTNGTAVDGSDQIASITAS